MSSPAIPFQSNKTMLKERRIEEKAEQRQIERLKLKVQQLRKVQLARGSSIQRRHRVGRGTVAHDVPLSDPE